MPRNWYAQISLITTLTLVSCSSNVSTSNSAQPNLSAEQVNEIAQDIINLNCDPIEITQISAPRIKNDPIEFSLNAGIDLAGKDFVAFTANKNDLQDHNQVNSDEFPALYEKQFGIVSDNESISLTYDHASAKTLIIGIPAGRRYCTDLTSFQVANRYSETFQETYDDYLYMDYLNNVVVSSGQVSPVGEGGGFDPNGEFASDVVAHWPMNDSLNDGQADESTGNHPGVCSGNECPLLNDGAHYEGAYTFANDKLDVGSFDISGSELTLSAWIKPTNFNTQDGRIISKSTGTANENHYWMLSTIYYNSEYRLRFRLKTSNGGTKEFIATSGGLQIGVWMHIAATYDGAQMCLYKGGSQVGCSAKTGTISQNPSVTVALGNNPSLSDNVPFRGEIDDVVVLKRALSPQEINTLAQPVTASFESLPVHTVSGEVMYDLNCSWSETGNGLSFGVSFDSGLTFETLSNGEIYNNPNVFPTDDDDAFVYRFDFESTTQLESLSCSWNTDEPPPPVCGNNIKEAGEECDGADSSACPGLCQPDCTCGTGGGGGSGTIESDSFERITVSNQYPHDQASKGAADFDNDGCAELISSAWHDHASRGGIYLYYNTDCGNSDSNGSYSWVQIDATEDNYSTEWDVGDVDGDGDLDLFNGKGAGASQSYNSIMTVFLNPYIPNGAAAVRGIWPSFEIPGQAGGGDSGIGTHDVASCDFNGDSYADIATRNELLTIFYSTGPAQYDVHRNMISYQHTIHEEGLDCGDIDGDGDDDVFLNGYWVENTGNPNSNTWLVHDVLNASQLNYYHSQAAVDLVDINGDGQLEAVLVPAESPTGKVRYLAYSGNPRIASNWTDHEILPTGSYLHGVECGDFDSDGDMDCASAEMHIASGSNDSVYVFVNELNENNSFRTVEIDSVGSHNIRLADANGDGKLDIFGANFADNSPYPAPFLWINQVESNTLPLDQWNRRVIDTQASGQQQVLVGLGDLNGDNRPDIATGNKAYLSPANLTSGSFTNIALAPPLNNAAAIVDFDGDGKRDIIGFEFKNSANESTPYHFHLAENLGGSTPDFSVHELTGINDAMDILKSSGGGDLDFLQGIAIAPFSPGSMQVATSWHYNPPLAPILKFTPGADPFNGSAWTMNAISNNTEYEDLYAADFDGDGKIDILKGKGILKNNGGGSFSEIDLGSLCGIPSEVEDIDRVAFADVDGDGKLDAVFGEVGVNALGIVGWCRQINPTSWQYFYVDTVWGPQSLDVQDMDNDGDLDLVIGEHRTGGNAASCRLFIFENLGNGQSWTRHLIYTGDEHHDGTEAVDLDLDGDKDIVSIGFTHRRVIVYENLAIH